MFATLVLMTMAQKPIFSMNWKSDMLMSWPQYLCKEIL